MIMADSVMLCHEVRASQLAQASEYQLHNRVENLADVLTRSSGLLQGEVFALKKTRASGHRHPQSSGMHTAARYYD